jgi:hypothetical protein
MLIWLPSRIDIKVTAQRQSYRAQDNSCRAACRPPISVAVNSLANTLADTIGRCTDRIESFAVIDVGRCLTSGGAVQEKDQKKKIKKKRKKEKEHLRRAVGCEWGVRVHLVHRGAPVTGRRAFSRGPGLGRPFQNGALSQIEIRPKPSLSNRRRR